jgi:hypothetical protein
MLEVMMLRRVVAAMLMRQQLTVMLDHSPP